VVLSIAAALVFGVGLVASGKAANLVSPITVAFTARVIGVVIVALPLIAQRRLRLTRAALPLVIISGVGEIIGSALSAWGAQTSIAVVAVLGSQFAAIAAVLAYVLFGERLSRVQTVGVVLIVVGVSLLAASGI
jgi:drug/metabolite transporter (DMT)-like permease